MGEDSVLFNVLATGNLTMLQKAYRQHKLDLVVAAFLIFSFFVGEGGKNGHKGAGSRPGMIGKRM